MPWWIMLLLVVLSFSFLRDGSSSKHRQSLNVSSAAADATVVPSGLMVRLSTLAVCPWKKVKYILGYLISHEADIMHVLGTTANIMPVTAF